MSAAADRLMERLTQLTDGYREARELLHEIGTHIAENTTIYDPVRDRYCIQIPGFIVRRLHLINECTQLKPR